MIQFDSKWQDLLKNQRGINSSEYNHSIRVSYDDGTLLFFCFAFCVLDAKNNEVGIFTEHNGNHLLTYKGATIELLESKWSEVGTPDLFEN